LLDTNLDPSWKPNPSQQRSWVSRLEIFILNAKSLWTKKNWKEKEKRKLRNQNTKGKRVDTCTYISIHVGWYMNQWKCVLVHTHTHTNIFVCKNVEIFNFIFLKEQNLWNKIHGLLEYSRMFYFRHENFKFHYLYSKHVSKLHFYSINQSYFSNFENIMNLLNDVWFLHPMNML
jgi:hypothetical protein